MAIQKPPVVPIWSDSNTTSADLIKPSDAQIGAGWPLSSTPPSRQRFNWLLNFLANGVRYFSRRGLTDYDSTETYQSGDIVRGNDGLVYQSLANDNISHAPSASPNWWGPVQGPTPAVDDSTGAFATTKFVLQQLASVAPLMNAAAAAIGSSKRFARADHVHPSDTSKANTAGTYGGLSVGFATNAGNATTAGFASNAGNASSANYAANAGNADTVDGYHATDLWRNNQSSYSAGANGYMLFPNGFRLVWGVVTMGSGASATVTTASSFNSVALGALVTMQTASNDDESAGYTALGLNSITLHNGGNGTRNITYWIWGF